MYSVDLYRRAAARRRPAELGRERRHQARLLARSGWPRSGGRSPGRRRTACPCTRSRSRRRSGRFPLMDPAGVVGAAFLESDGYVDPSQLCHALAKGARAAGRRDQHPHPGACDRDGRGTARRSRRRRQGREPGPHRPGRHRVRGRRRRGRDVCRGDRPPGGRAGPRRPDVAPVPGDRRHSRPGSLDAPRRWVVLPTLRDPDLLVYWRPEGAGLRDGWVRAQPGGMAGRPHVVRRHPGRLQRPAAARVVGAVRGDRGQRRQAGAGDGRRRHPQTFINGPEAFTPDNEFCLGETDRWPGSSSRRASAPTASPVPAGIGKMMAEWILDGQPSLDLWHMDISRFGPAYASPSYTLLRTTRDLPASTTTSAIPALERESGRPLRMSPVYEWHREHGASFGEKAGWERVNYYETNVGLGDEALRPQRLGRPVLVAGDRRRAPCDAHDGCALRRDVVRQAQRQRTRRGRLPRAGCATTTSPASVGDITYTQALNARGGIEADFTVTRRRCGRVPGGHRHRVRHRTTRPGCASGPARTATTSESTTSPDPWCASRCGDRRRGRSSAR